MSGPGVELMTPCDPVPLPPLAGVPFRVPVGNVDLVFDGRLLTVEPRPNPVPDGTWGQLTFQDGRIVGASVELVPAYTPSPCAPIAPSGPGGSASVTVAPGACNLLSQGAGGLTAQVHAQGTGGVSVSGCGTVTNPLVINAPSASGAITAQSGDTPIRVTGNGSTAAPLVIGMNPVALTPGTYGGFQVDQFGRMLGYTAPSAAVVGGVSGATFAGSTNVMATETSPGNYALDLTPMASAAGSYSLGRYTLSVSNVGRILSITPNGSPSAAGQFYTPAHPTNAAIVAKVVTVDANGTITSIVNA